MRGTRMPFAEATDEQLECRTRNHHWDDNPQPTRRAQFGRQEEMRCTNCHAERHDTFNVVGDLIQRYYTYPPGYAALGKDVRIAAVRVEVWKRKKSAARRSATNGRNRNKSGRRLQAV